MIDSEHRDRTAAQWFNRAPRIVVRADPWKAKCPYLQLPSLLSSAWVSTAPISAAAASGVAPLLSAA